MQHSECKAVNTAKDPSFHLKSTLDESRSHVKFRCISKFIVQLICSTHALAYRQTGTGEVFDISAHRPTLFLYSFANIENESDIVNYTVLDKFSCSFKRRGLNGIVDIFIMIWINCFFQCHSNQTSPIIMGHIECGSRITNQTSTNNTPHYYLFNNYNSGNIITIDLCGSQYDTYLYFRDDEFNILQKNDDYCDLQSQITSNNTLSAGIYYIEVNGYLQDTGRYNLSLSCSITSSPTTPTVMPTDHPSSPSQHPTTIPSNAPTLPTLSPTHTPKELCGDNEWCYYMNIYPLIGQTVSEMIAISSIDDDVDTYFHIQFTAKNNHCVEPMITVILEEIDLSDHEFEYYEIYDHYNNSITKCTGEYDSNCGNWIYCLSNQSLGINAIHMNDVYNITIFEPYSIHSFCNPIHPYSINMQLTLTCSDKSLSPTSAPTSSPSYPTASPTDHPSYPTGAPTLAPSRAPTSYEPSISSFTSGCDQDEAREVIFLFDFSDNMTYDGCTNWVNKGSVLWTEDLYVYYLSKTDSSRFGYIVFDNFTNVLIKTDHPINEWSDGYLDLIRNNPGCNDTGHTGSMKPNLSNAIAKAVSQFTGSTTIKTIAIFSRVAISTEDEYEICQTYGPVNEIEFFVINMYDPVTLNNPEDYLLCLTDYNHNRMFPVRYNREHPYPDGELFALAHYTNVEFFVEMMCAVPSMYI